MLRQNRFHDERTDASVCDGERETIIALAKLLNFTTMYKDRFGPRIPGELRGLLLITVNSLSKMV